MPDKAPQREIWRKRREKYRRIVQYAGSVRCPYCPALASCQEALERHITWRHK